jgi:hypothetical protein
MSKTTPMQLWEQARIEHEGDPEGRRQRYRQLMIDHGHLKEAPTPIVTRYQSYCTECDQVIYPGDLIAWFPMCTRPAVHRDCDTP